MRRQGPSIDVPGGSTRVNSTVCSGQAQGSFLSMLRTEKRGVCVPGCGSHTIAAQSGRGSHRRKGGHRTFGRVPLRLRTAKNDVAPIGGSPSSSARAEAQVLIGALSFIRKYSVAPRHS